MALVFTEEQRMIEASVRDFCTTQASVQQLRNCRDQGSASYDAKAWQQMCELGWGGVILPEEFGGSGLGMYELGIILIEMGRNLSPLPLVSTVLLGAQAILTGGSPQQKQNHLPAIAAGKQCLALALEEAHQHNPTNITLSADIAGDIVTLNGHKTMVIDGMAADYLVVVASTSNVGLSLFLVPADTKGLSKARLTTVDSRGYANLEFKQVQVNINTLLGELDQGEGLLEKLLDWARIGTAAELLGVIERAFEITLGYLREREQFGVVIGSFQSLKHRMADMFCELQLARSTVLAALSKADSATTQELATHASLCKAKVGSIARRSTSEAIQMHGGIGMTDEYDIGLFLKRSRALEQLFGNVTWHQNRYAQLQGY